MYEIHQVRVTPRVRPAACASRPARGGARPTVAGGLRGVPNSPVQPQNRGMAMKVTRQWARRGFGRLAERCGAVGRGVVEAHHSSEAMFAGLATTVALLLSATGLVFFGPPAVDHYARRAANLRRRRLAEVSGRPVPEPYAPLPEVQPVPGVGYRLRRTVRKKRPSLLRRKVEGYSADPATWRDLAWLLLSPLLMLLAILPLFLILCGLFALLLPGLLDGFPANPPWYGSWPDTPGAALAVGGATVALGLWIAEPVLRLHDGISEVLLRPTEKAQLSRRVRELAETRTEAVDAQAAELRRIERDLHDGVQARLIAVGLHLGVIEQLAGTDPEAVKAMAAQAREASEKALAELRALVRGIHPPVLAERGLVDALRAVAVDSPLETEVTADLPGEPPAPVRTAVYFAVCELLANAAKHAEAARVWIDLHTAEPGSPREALRVTVTDDGRGGARFADGGGLRGIERRLATFDGVLALNSPQGGPTLLTLEIPCALSSRRTSTSSEKA